MHRADFLETTASSPKVGLERTPLTRRQLRRGDATVAAVLLFGTALGTPTTARAQSCIFDRTPAVPVPAELGQDPVTGHQVLRPVALMQDATDYTGNQMLTSNFPLAAALDVEQGVVFNAIAAGFQVWDARGDYATDPRLRVTIDGWEGDIPIHVTMPRENDWDFYAIDALPDPGGPAGRFLVALGGDNAVGLSLWRYDDSGAAVLYQDGDLDGSGDFTVYLQVYAAEIAGRAWVFGGGTRGQELGVHIYDASAAGALPAAPCVEDRNSDLADCDGVYRGVPIAAPTRFLAGAAHDGAHYLIRSGGTPWEGLEIYDVSIPTAPVMVASALADTFVDGVALWASDGHLVAAARLSDRLAVWMLDDCIAAGGCGDIGAPTEHAMPVPIPVDALGLRLQLSWLDDRPMLFAGFFDPCHEGEPTGHIECLLDMSEPFAPVDVSPRRTIVDQGVEVDYWSWYYATNTRGFAWATPVAGVFSGPYFYRSALSILDVHEVSPLPSGGQSGSGGAAAGGAEPSGGAATAGAGGGPSSSPPPAAASPGEEGGCGCRITQPSRPPSGGWLPGALLAGFVVGLRWRAGARRERALPLGSRGASCVSRAGTAGVVVDSGQKPSGHCSSRVHRATNPVSAAAP